MTEALATRPVGMDIEKVLIGGDLAQLNPDQRLNYYNTLCNSLGLNPLTQPFQYIVLNNKLQLYAKKDCTEQLRKIHGVSITKVDPKQIGDLIVVVAEACDASGRVDSSTGAVAIGNAKGEDLANKMMKAETKAKRRVTLSLCGLGMLDETEVQTLKGQGVASEPQGNKWEPNPTPTTDAIEYPQTIPTPAQAIRNALTNPSAISHEPDIQPRSKKGTPQSTQTAAAPPSAPQPQPEPIQGEAVAERIISDKQKKFLFAIGKSLNLSDSDIKDAMSGIGLNCHRDQIPASRFNELLDTIDPDYKMHPRKEQQ
jgi:hypothetical protein